MNEKLPKAMYQGEIKLGDIILPCAVLDNGTRVIRERPIATALGKKGSGGFWAKKRTAESGRLLPEYVSPQYLKNYISAELEEKLLSPIRFKTKSGTEAWGLSALLLPEICNIWLKAREQGALKIDEQLATALKAEILMRGLATIGIIALIDEATGYQEIRDRNALEKILEKYIAKELLPWAKMFPDTFYENMFRLKGWQYKPLSAKRPGIIGTYTNDIVYGRLEKGVLEELQKINPVNPAGYRKHRHHQWLTEDIGNPKLKSHLEGVIALMRASPNWITFLRLLNRAYPRKGGTFEMPLDDIDAK